MPGLSPLDFAVLAVYGLVVVGIGAWANRRQKTTEDYLLGGRRMRWWAVGISLIATSFSSVALIGGTGFGFSKGMGYLQLQLGDIVAITIAVAFFLPFYARLQLTTAYEYLEARFGVVARVVASLLFVAQTLFRSGVLVYGPALALSAVLDLDIQAAILVSGAAAVAYSAAGGITAVVWTDLIQFAVVVFGVGYCVSLIAGDVTGGLPAVLDFARAHDRLDVVSTAVDPSTPYNLLGALVPYGTLALAMAATNQQAVQRYMACRDLGQARRAAFLAWGIGCAAVALTLFLGVSLFAWSALAPGGDVLAGKGDEALPLFIVHRLPPGIAGLLVAAIFAASMSSMDSAIHSMSTAMLVDFVRRFRRRPLEARKELRLARGLTVLFGLVAAVIAMRAAGRDTPMLDTLLQWLSFFAGPLLGLFTLGMISTRANQAGAVAATMAVGVGVILVGTVGFQPLLEAHGIHPLWLGPASLVATVLLGRLLSPLLGGPPEAKRLRGLTWQRRGEPRQATRAS